MLEGQPVTPAAHPKADIFLDDITVSRRHADFVPPGSAYEVQDAGLAQRHLPEPRAHRRAAPLANGDEIQIGKFRLVYLVGDAG